MLWSLCRRPCWATSAMKKFQRPSLFLAAPATLLLLGAGWTGKYKAPMAPDSADIVITRGAPELGARSIQLVQAYDNPGCHDTPSYGVVGAMRVRSKGLHTRARAGNRIYFLFSTTEFSTAQVENSLGLRGDMCFNLVSFSPQAGNTYYFRQDLTLVGCSVSATASDGSLIGSLQVEQVEACEQAR